MRPCVLLILAGLAMGCSGLTDGSSGPIPVESEIVFLLREAHDLKGKAGPPGPVLFLATAEQLECCNYQILTHVESRGGMLRVDVLGVYLPEGMCQTAFGPARAQIEVASPAGLDRLVFRYGDRADDYSVAVDETSIHIRGDCSTVTHPEDTLVWRFPRQSFVYTCGTLLEDSCFCEQFRDSLLAHLGLERIVVPETGLWPYPRQTMGYYYNMTPLVYRYASESEFEEAGALLDTFTRKFLSGRQGIGLALDNWRNERWASWMVKDTLHPRRQREPRTPG